MSSIYPEDKIKSMTRRQFTKISSNAILGLAISDHLINSHFKGSKIKIGQIGTTHSHAEGKIETLKKLNNIFEIVGVVEDDIQKRKLAQEKISFADLNWMTEEQLLNTKGLHAVTVETDLDELVPASLRCIEEGVHVHIDKPPGKSLDALDNLLNRAERKGLVVQTGYMFRYNPAFKFCLNAVKQGWLGEIFEVDGIISKTISENRRHTIATSYGGAMMLLGCHLIDILIAVCGKPEKVTGFRKRTFPLKDNLHDNELAVFEYPQATATIRSALIETEGTQRRQFIVCGDEGTIEIRPLEPPNMKLTLKKSVVKYRSGVQEISLPKMSGRYDDQLIDFAHLIRAEKEPDYTTEHDHIVHEALLKAAGILGDGE